MYLTKLFRSFSMGILVVSGFLAPLSTAHAGMIGTNALLTGAQRAMDRTQLELLLAREDVAVQLRAFGVDAGDALMRVERMTDEEVASLNRQLGELPAGGDLLGAALIVFIVLVITDVIGATDVFPFIRPVKK